LHGGIKAWSCPDCAIIMQSSCKSRAFPAAGTRELRGAGDVIPSVECFDRWYSSLLTLMRVMPQACVPHDAQTSGLLGSPDHRRIGTADRERAAFAASALRAAGQSIGNPV